MCPSFEPAADDGVTRRGIPANALLSTGTANAEVVISPDGNLVGTLLIKLPTRMVGSLHHGIIVLHLKDDC